MAAVGAVQVVGRVEAVPGVEPVGVLAGVPWQLRFGRSVEVRQNSERASPPVEVVRGVGHQADGPDHDGQPQQKCPPRDFEPDIFSAQIVVWEDGNDQEGARQQTKYQGDGQALPERAR